jgi:hypothetical protein
LFLLLEEEREYRTKPIVEISTLPGLLRRNALRFGKERVALRENLE